MGFTTQKGILHKKMGLNTYKSDLARKKWHLTDKKYTHSLKKY